MNHIFNKDKLDAGAANEFTMFVISQGIDDARLLLTMSEDDFKSMGYNVDFKTFQSLQAQNKMCDKQVLDSMSEDDENVLFLDLSKCTLMCHMMHEHKVTTVPLTTGDSMPSVPLSQSDSSKTKLEAARQSSLAMCNVGKPLLAPMPMAGKTLCRVTFGT